MFGPVINKVMSNIELFGQDNKVGDLVVVYLNSGKDISGEVLEIGESYILIRKGDGKLMRLFENIVGAWETIEKNTNTPSEIVQQLTVEDNAINDVIKGSEANFTTKEEESQGKLNDETSPIERRYEPRPIGLKIIGKIDLGNGVIPDDLREKLDNSTSSPIDVSSKRTDSTSILNDPKETIDTDLESNDDEIEDDNINIVDDIYNLLGQDTKSQINDDYLLPIKQEISNTFENAIAISGVSDNQNISTNARALVIDRNFVIAKHDNGNTILCSRATYLSLDNNIDDLKGKRIFCCKDEDQKRCKLWIPSMTYSDLKDLFFAALEQDDHGVIKRIARTISSIPEMLIARTNFSALVSLAESLRTMKICIKSHYSLTDSQREETNRLIEDYIEHNPGIEIKTGDIQTLIESKLGIRLRGAYVKYLLTILNVSKDKETVGTDNEYYFIKDYNVVSYTLTELNESFDIDKETLLYHLDAIANELEPHYNTVDKPNAFVQKVNKTSFTVGYNAESKRCYYNSVLDFNLLKRMSEFTGDNLPVRVLTYVRKKTEEVYVSSVVDVLSIRDHINNIIKHVEDGNYAYARRYNQNIQSFLLQYLSPSGKIHLKRVLNILKKASFDIKALPSITINFSQRIQAQQEQSKKAALFISSTVDAELAIGNIEKAIDTLLSAIQTDRLQPKDQSALYHKLIQIYTSMANPEEAIKIYQEWITYGEKLSLFTAKKLSRMYTDLARLQYSIPGREYDALNSLEIALENNPDNKLSLSIQEQIKEALEEAANRSGDDLQLSPGYRLSHPLDIVSDMLDIDIQEHKYTDKRIISKGGPTIEIANSLLEEAKNLEEAEAYPIFLETAKAFNDLKFYNQQDYLLVVANYARLKGDSLFKNFKRSLLGATNSNSETSLNQLCRLKDSAQSYYIESLNLWSYISPEEDDDEDAETTKDVLEHENVVLEILVNHMILDVAYYYRTNEENSSQKFESLFKMQFKEVFFNCIRSNDSNLHSIAARTIVKVGSYSAITWNKLAWLPNGIGGLYGELSSMEKRFRFYSSINNIEASTVSTQLSPKDFLQETFKNHSSERLLFTKQGDKFREEVLSPLSMGIISSKWKDLSQFYKLLSPTDLESSTKVDEILKILKPYPNRRDEERSTLLYQVTEIIDEQIHFINTNTTFYGRTFFYPLLNKWANEIKSIRKERVASKHPHLYVTPDPAYILSSDNNKSVSLVIKNNGETTAEGFIIKLSLTPHSCDDSFEYENQVASEIPSGQKAGIIIELNNDIDCSSGIDAWTEVSAIYQGNLLPGIEINFTLEEEPTSTLEPEDIIWSDGPITPPDLFFGRQELIDKFKKHYLSTNRHKPYILYGLTRTGKSSIAKYLGEQITGEKVKIHGETKTILHFSMDLDEAAKCPNAKEVWDFFIRRCLYERILKYSNTYSIDVEKCKPSFSPRSYELEDILKALNECGYYPFITMDEFSHMKTLISSGRLTSAFLHTLRKDTFEGLASFMYIGTYDINDLLTDKQYGITGQLTHCINYQLNEIDEVSAKCLINVLGDKLIFTEDAQDLICTLSGCVPYFIQIICQNCGNYAVEHKRRFIGYPELLEVVKILTGETEVYDDESSLQRLTINTFEDNQYSANDPIYVLGLVASISYLNRDCDNNNVPPHGAAINELERLWAEYGITNARYYIAEAIKILKAKKIIAVDDKEMIPTYVIIVDLYRRWCKVEFPDINLTLSSLLN